ncbi:MAG TPA: tRNA pseudouridine(55) synthase TruB [Bacteroidia bacterium]|nr:tRNA pseudouridine(55) synthase TruB [Bacteroidia bacterium]
MPYDFYHGECLLINKPYTWSSFQAVNKIKHALKQHPSWIQDGEKRKVKIGHAGTLDPLATGLLIVCTGKMTKRISEFMGLEKEYTGTFTLGATTPCYDLEKPVDQHFPTDHISEDMILKTASGCMGRQMQVPPLFSAVQVEGKRAYELAREGKHTELKAREIEITQFEITEIKLPQVNFRIRCSKGTYIRSIARDFGQALQSGAHLSALCRTRIGEFSIEDAMDPQTFSEMIRKDQMLR